MRVLINIGHPGQVHLFKNLIWELSRRGHQCKITTIDKDVSLHLLNAYGFEYEVVGKERPTRASKAIEMARIDYRLFRIARSFRPDLLLGGVGNVYVAHVGKLIGKPSIVFDDTEHAKIDHRLMDSFVSSILTPSCYRGDIGPKQIRYNGYHELAYLHPNRFTPNPAVLTEIGLTSNDPFIIVRFVSWQASHDVGQHGISDKVRLVKALEKYGRVLITSEGKLPEDLEPYRIKVSPEKLHDLLYYATLYVGDGGTTASEAAVLGTPAVFISTLYCGYQLDEEKYGLLYLFSDPISGLEKGVKKSINLLGDPNLKKNARLNRLKMLEDKVDVTDFMLWFIENYPMSYHQLKADAKQHNPLVT